MNKYSLTNIAFILLLSVATNISADSDFDLLLAKMEKIDKYVYDAPLFITNHSLPGLRAIGKVTSETSFHHPSPHIENKLTEFITLKFSGLTIYGAINKDSSLAPIKITITGTQWKILEGFNIGTASARIKGVLGEAFSEKKSKIEYRGETEQVVFHTNNNLITKIELNYYYD